MQCKLAVVVPPPADFQGQIGAEVQLTVSGTKGTAVIVSANYAGKDLSDPWKFTIEAGVQPLGIIIENDVNRDLTHLQEVCDAGKSELFAFFYRASSPLHLFQVQGI
jgi:hypothetical protein